jgi:hypothetical protein
MKEDLTKIVKAKSIDDFSFSTHWGGNRYSFTNKGFTDCPLMVYNRNKKRLVLEEKIIKPQLRKADKKGVDNG